MKNPTKKFMQVDFESVKSLGLQTAALLAYLIYKSGNDNVVCITKSQIMSDLQLTKKEYEKCIKDLISRGLISVISNYLARLNGLKLNEAEIINFISGIGSPSTDNGSPSTDTIKKTIGSLSTDNGSPSTDNGSPSTDNGSPSTDNGSQGVAIKQETINKKQYNNPSESEALSHEQAREVNNNFNDYLDKLAQEAGFSTPDIVVDYTDNSTQINSKVKQARKSRKDAQDKPKRKAKLDIQPKWLPFIEFIKNEFSILYPVHRNSQATIAKAHEFAAQHDNRFDEQAILDIVNKIESHYLPYCKEKGDYAVSPVRYINDMIWTTELKSMKKSMPRIGDEDFYTKENMTW